MAYLNSNQLKQYNDEGYISPLNIISKDEALDARKEIELIEKKLPKEIDKSGRYNVHLISPKLDSIVHNSKILDAVESIICLLYTSPSPRDRSISRMPSSA